MFARLFATLTACLALVASSFATTSAPQTNPTIVGLRGRTVFVKVPAGYESVTVSQVVGLRNRVVRPLVTRATKLEGETVTFTLKSAVARRALLLTGKRAAPIARATGAGLQLFVADPALNRSGGFSMSSGASMSVAALGTSSTAANALAIGSSVPADTRTVTQSDIWQRSGNRLYFFNQLRGLQVFDVSDPDNPALLGQLREGNRGEQMYLLSSTHVALLTRPSFYFSIYSSSTVAATLDSGAGAVVIADVSAARPREVARVPYAGYLVESRMVGTALYLVSEVYSNTATGLRVTSFDLRDPANPVLVDTLDLGSYGGVVSATDKFLFVARYSDSWRRSVLDVIDISAPNGALVKRGKITTEGIVGDKFKLHLEGDVLTVVSNVPRGWGGTVNDPPTPSRTAIETFDLSRPATPVRLDAISVGEGETVHATRFVGDRLYVVTFFTIDPLWVIDLSNPRSLQVLGELKVPGFSTYIEPLGDRLVSIGRIEGRTAVSLFDVSDPATPRVLSQIPLGDGASWSTANWDEKAFYVNPAHEIILVPFSGYNAADGWADRMQILTLTRDSIRLRGVVSEGFAARRTTIVGRRYLAVSSSHLVTLDLSNRDQPRVTSKVEIAWRVDRVFLQGEHLVQIGGPLNTPNAAPTISVAGKATPDEVLTELTLENVPVIGATVRGSRLYVAQQNVRSYLPIFIMNSNGTTAANTVANPLILTVYDLQNLPALTRLGRTEANVDTAFGYTSTQLDAVWPNDQTLVWLRPQWSSWWWVMRPMPVIRPMALAQTVNAPVIAANSPAAATVASLSTSDLTAGTAVVNATPPALTLTSQPAVATSAVSTSMIWLPPFYRSSGGSEMVVFDVTDSAAPKFASTVNVRTSQSGDWSAPIAVDGRLYLSALSYDTTPETDGRPARQYRHFLRTVDFANPTAPVVSAEINIPGRLVGVRNAGETLLTVGCGYDDDGTPTNQRVFHTSHFSGTAATLVDQLSTPFGYDPYAVADAALFIGTYPLAGGQPGQLQAWTIGSDERFALAGQLSTPTFTSLSHLNGLLVGYGAGLPAVFDVSNPNALRPLKADTSELTGGDLRRAAGGAGLGIWQPLGDQGVGVITLP